MNKYGKLILNELIDQYERSKSFVGKNVQNQYFRIKIDKLFPMYDDESQFEIFSEVNLKIKELESKGLIVVERKKRGKIDTDVVLRVTLVTDNIDECYNLLDRKSKYDKNTELKKILNEYVNKTSLLRKYCEKQIERLNDNKKIQFCNEDCNKLEQVLKVLSNIETIKEETYVRNFSVRVLGDSKAFEKIKNVVIDILYEYGDYINKDSILQDLNIVNNPGYVYIKGKACIILSGQTFDLTKINGSIGLSSSILNDIERVNVVGSKVITIENLTTFNSFEDVNAVIIYLGGFHNSIRRKFICKIHENNSSKEYFHYGDIDVGGFEILMDLRRKTGINFLPLNMDTKMLSKYLTYTKRLSENDKKRLNKMIGGEFDEVIKYMLENDCKLEQEAIV